MHADGYDPLDPKGNITIKWDLLQSNSDTNDVKVSLLNFQLYRHIELPGWKLGWEWLGKEVIWSIQGAEATEQGNCSRFKGGQLPHCCEKKPLIVDLLPGAPYNIQTSNCCKGGVLSSMIQDPTKYAAVFQMNIGAGGVADSDFDMPQNFSLGVPGYTCAKPVQVAPSKYSSDGGRRWTQALGTWNVTCIYSQYQASTSPKCCVSLSAFYNDSIVHCPKCSCSCQGLSGSKCIWRNTIAIATSKRLKSRAAIDSEMHTNYSGWNLVALHPNLKSLTQVFSFNYHPLNQYGHINDSGMFWGVEYYNDMLLQEGEVGNVQSEMLLHKDEGIFSFREGWVFPKRILFNGDECVMPPPGDYPRLPKNTARAASFTLSIIFSSLFMLLIIFAC
ncbi:COBRA-like protein 6 [Gossypium arboreum]|uniref:COBRA-like protein 6 n=1 Tax=Gossypium arboreum TaxID=29729 RepID=A0A0B0PH80_GOSAR|nr:COBRA-like protein 6 [Gossypium arboreum]